jgi:hypothetical protein
MTSTAAARVEPPAAAAPPPAASSDAIAGAEVDARWSAPPPPHQRPTAPMPPIHDIEPSEKTIHEHPEPDTAVQKVAPIRRPEPSQVRAIDPPPMEVIELDLEPDPSIPPPSIEAPHDDAFESRSRLVSASPVTPEGDESRAALRGAVSEPTLEVSEPADLSSAELEAIEEPAPSSSRRPITVEEKLLQLAEEDDAVHVPPPESGKLPAAPILNLEDPDGTGVLRRPAEEKPTTAPAPTATSAEPEVVRAEAAKTTEVAAFVGKAPAPKPSTFGELLDLALRL